MVGFDTDPNGTIMSPFFTFGIYLDNWSSGFLVEGNIIRTATSVPIFVHGGSNNTIKNNVLFNATTSNNLPSLGQLMFYGD